MSYFSGYDIINAEVGVDWFTVVETTKGDKTFQFDKSPLIKFKATEFNYMPKDDTYNYYLNRYAELYKSGTYVLTMYLQWITYCRGYVEYPNGDSKETGAKFYPPTVYNYEYSSSPTTANNELLNLDNPLFDTGDVLYDVNDTYNRRAYRDNVVIPTNKSMFETLWDKPSEPLIPPNVVIANGTYEGRRDPLFPFPTSNVYDAFSFDTLGCLCLGRESGISRGPFANNFSYTNYNKPNTYALNSRLYNSWYATVGGHNVAIPYIGGEGVQVNTGGVFDQQLSATLRQICIASTHLRVWFGVELAPSI